MKAKGRQDMMAFLEKKGCNVVNITERFNGSPGGIWLSAEENSNFNLNGFYGTLGVKPSLDAQVKKRGWFFEWYDAGTMMCWPQ